MCRQTRGHRHKLDLRGIFGAAPSVALATLVLTARSEGLSYAAKAFGGDALQRSTPPVAGWVPLDFSCFAGAVWKALPEHRLAIALCVAGALWFAVSTCLWWLRKAYW